MVTTLTALTIFVLMISLGVQTAPSNLTTLWQQPSLLGRSLLTTLVLFPFGAAVIGYVVLSGGQSVGRVAVGLAVLAAAPGAPPLSRRAAMAGSTPTLPFLPAPLPPAPTTWAFIPDGTLSLLPL